MGEKVHANHGRDHIPPKYGTTTGGGADKVNGMLYLPSDAETDGQVLTRDSGATHGVTWADGGAGGAQRPIKLAFTAVVSSTTTPKKWPGAMRVVPVYGFNVAGSDSGSQTAYARKQAIHDQTAANYAAAAATAQASDETDWLLDTNIRYQCWVGVRVAAGATTAHIGIDSTAIGTNEISLSGTPSDNFALYRLFSDKTFAAGETITLKAYRTSSSGNIEIDQLYFFPTSATNYNVGPSSTDATLEAFGIFSFASLGPTAASQVDARFSSTTVKDTQTANDLKDAESSAWAFLTDPGMDDIASFAEFDQEARVARHNYVTACYESSTDAMLQKGCYVSLSGDGVPMATARVYLPSAGFYYLGPSISYAEPPQLTLWRNAATGSSVPYGFDSTAVTTDVRVGEYFAISSYLDDYY